MTIEYINYGDNGRVAREKINTIMAEVEAHIPSIWPNGNWYLWPTDTGIPAIWVRLRAENNLTKRNSRQEMYTDLQLKDWITPTDTFPVWIVVGNANTGDGWQIGGVLMNAKTTDWHYVRRLYWDDWKLYFDWWLGVFKVIPNADDVSSAVAELRNELHTVAFTWKSSDLDNDAKFNSVPVMTEEEWEHIPWTAGDDKRYFIYE